MALRPSKGWHGVLWLPDCIGCHKLDSERAGVCPRGGETAIDDFSVGINLPIPVAGQTVPGDPIRKCAFLNHEGRCPLVDHKFRPDAPLRLARLARGSPDGGPPRPGPPW